MNGRTNTMKTIKVDAKPANSTGIAFYKKGKYTEIKNGKKLKVTKETKTTYQFNHEGETHSVWRSNENFLFTIINS